MRVRFIVSGLLVACAYVSSCAQQKVIVKTYAFTQLRLPGNMPVDEQGQALVKAPAVVHVLYIETKGEAPVWKRAYRNGQAYTLYTALVSEKDLDIGKNKADEQRITIHVKAGNTLWQLTLSPDTALKSNVPLTGKNISEDIILEGTYKGKTFTKRIQKPVELIAPEYM